MVMCSQTSNIVRVLLIAALVTFSGCDTFDSDCDTAAYPAIELVVKNEAGEYVCDQVTAVVFEDNFRDTLVESRINEAGQVILLSGAFEREGVYSLIITSDEYETYTDTQIVVRDGQCHVKTRELSVVVEPK